MDVWTLTEKLKIKDSEIDLLEKRISHVEEYLKKINTKLMLINKVSNEAVQDKKAKPSRVRTKRSTAKKS
jgi:hypothetical protein